MLLVSRCAERKTASTIINQQLFQLMREPCLSARLIEGGVRREAQHPGASW
jgi:hypothetical protein